MGIQQQLEPVTTSERIGLGTYTQDNTSALAQHDNLWSAAYVTGFVDGEGCFSISFSLRSKMKYGIEVRPSFSVSQHQRNKDVIEFLHDFFKCGGIRYSQHDCNFKFEVRSIHDIIMSIKNEHLKKNGLKTIINIAMKMNEAGKRKYSQVELLRIVCKMNV